MFHARNHLTLICIMHFFFSLQLNAAKVIAVGPGDRDKSGNVIPVCFKEGDEVLLPEYGGSEIKLGDKVYVCLSLSAQLFYV